MIVMVDACGCANACRHCAEDGRPPYGALFTLDALRALREEWGPLWPGLEPSAHPQFPEIYGKDIVPEGGLLSTTGFGFARRDDYRAVLTHLREMGYTMMSLTLHGLQVHHDWFTARKGAFEDIIMATRRGKEMGFGIHWNVWLDRENLEEMPAVVALAQTEIGGSPYLSVPNHRVGERLRRFERLRPSVDDLNKRLPRDLVRKGYSPLQEGPAEQFSEDAWLRAWRRDPHARTFRSSLDPDAWPPQPPYDNVRIRITSDRSVYLDLPSDPRTRLGEVSEGKETIFQRLRELPVPEGLAFDPEQAILPPADASLVHARGLSVRFKAAACLFHSRQSTGST